MLRGVRYDTRPARFGERDRDDVILFDLRCANDHVFEGWFADSAAYEAQAVGRKIACPICASRKVEKAVMAPRIGKGGAAATQIAAQALRALSDMRGKVEATCDYVGERFAEEARRMHHGEVERHAIYGEASDEEARDLRDEGIEFTRMPWVPRFQS